MRKNTKKAVCIFSAVLLLVCSFPISAFAVDPVSASVIANSFAQAITAYGASHGVSMTFDGISSGNTDQIGQSVHDLWARFRAGQQTADDYDTIAAAVFPGLYNKVVKAGGAAVVGMSIAQEYMPDIDAFWNWLLSGPAEMVKVDNAYQWSVDPSTGAVVRPVVYSGDYLSLNGYTLVSAPVLVDTASSSYMYSGEDVFFFIGVTSRGAKWLYAVGPSPIVIVRTEYTDDGPVYTNLTYQSGYNYGAYLSKQIMTASGLSSSQVPSYTTTYNTVGDNPTPFFGSYDTGVEDSNGSVTVQPYVGDAVARPVPIPDVGDPDYGPLPWAGDLDLPWNDTLFGDGTGTLTDAQKGAITEELDGVIENDGTLILEGDQTAPGPDEDEDDPPSDDPDDYGVIGLENIFPFCIPFDIYNFLSALAATPTAPHFTATLQLPSALGGAQTIDLDFDNPTFNQLAQLLRLLELLAFIVGLALLTRSMFIRG